MENKQEKLIIKKDNSTPSSGWRPVTISVDYYNNIKMIAEEANMPISKVVGLLIEFALANVVIEK